MKIPKKSDFIKISECGRYGLLANTELWRIAGDFSYMAGYVADPNAIEIAVDEAELEMMSLLAEYAAVG